MDMFACIGVFLDSGFHLDFRGGPYKVFGNAWRLFLWRWNGGEIVFSHLRVDLFVTISNHL